MFSSTSILLSYWYKLQIHWSDTSEGLIIYWKFHIQPKKSATYILWYFLVYWIGIFLWFFYEFFSFVIRISLLNLCSSEVWSFLVCVHTALHFLTMQNVLGGIHYYYFFDKRLEGYSIIWPLKSMRHDIVV